MRAWIENDDDITPFIEIDVYDENGVMIEAHGIQCRPLPWRMELDGFDIVMTSKNAGREFDTDDIHDAIVIEEDEDD